MRDYQLGWYMKLLFQLAKSGGYLPLDCNLGTLAGAHSKQYWEANAGLVLACFKVQERDGRKCIYSNSVLSQIYSVPCGNNRGNCGNVKRGVSIYDVVLSETLNPLFEKAWVRYPLHVAKKVARKSFLSAVQRISKSSKISVEEAGEYIAHMAQVFAESPAGKRGKFTPHFSTWLNQDRFSDDPAEWNLAEEKQNALQKRLANNIKVIEQTFAEVGHGDDDGDAAEMAAARA